MMIRGHRSLSRHRHWRESYPCNTPWQKCSITDQRIVQYPDIRSHVQPGCQAISPTKPRKISLFPAQLVQSQRDGWPSRENGQIIHAFYADRMNFQFKFKIYSFSCPQHVAGALAFDSGLDRSLSHEFICLGSMPVVSKFIYPGMTQIQNSKKRG